jgi:hypothetical protein
MVAIGQLQAPVALPAREIAPDTKCIESCRYPITCIDSEGKNKISALARKRIDASILRVEQ